MCMATAGLIITGVSAAISVAGNSMKANQEASVENTNATIAKQNANVSLANASSKANQRSLQTEYQISNARAAAAGSGGAADAPSTANVESQIAGRGEYDQLSDIYAGQTQAKNFNDTAAQDQWQGQQAKDAVPMEDASTIASSGSTLYTKYGFGGQQPPMLKDASADSSLPWSTFYSGA